MSGSKPLLIVVGGPNGSGKTTLINYLIQKGKVKSQVINPDDIAKNEFGSYNYHIKASRVALQRRKAALTRKDDLAFETTFSGNSEIRDIIYAKQQGYQIVLYYVSLHSVLDNINRVEERRLKFGHGVSNTDIARRYQNSKHNLEKYAHLFDFVYLFDNSGTTRSRVAVIKNNEFAWINRKHESHPFFKEIISGYFY